MPVLCDACNEHFAFSRPDLKGKIKSLKQRALQEAISEGEEQDVVAIIRDDLTRYINVQATQLGKAIPCPWRIGQSPEPLLEFDQWLEIWGNQKHRRSWLSVCNNARSLECRLCISLSGMVRYALHQSVPDASYLTSKWVLNAGSLVPIMLRFQVFHEGHEVPLMTCMFHCDVDAVEKTLISRESSLPLERSSNRSDCIEFMTRNLNECLTSHPECMVAQASEWLPTRLLDLRFARGEKGIVSIIEKEDIAVPSQYLTLSHVWGSTSKPLQLTLDNYARMKTAGIPVHSMPLCYREVIQIAENLKMRYLWIDSLCIIQDCPKDWDKEALTMAQIYSNGLCNIAACDATDSDTSCFVERDPQEAKSITVRQEFGDGEATTIITPQWVRLARDYSSLYTRGWVVQERFLSTRLMHFAKFPIWECRSVLVTESYRQSTNSKISAIDDHFSGSERLWLTEKPEDRTVLLVRWLRLVFIFTRSKLTFEKDKLIAMAGLAKSFEAGLKENYYAGIWGGGHLVRCLLWSKYRIDPNSQPVPFAEYQAPSWSWAAFSAQVRMMHHLQSVKQEFIQVLSIWTEPKTGDPFGRIAAGELRLRGHLFEINNIARRKRNLQRRGECRFDYLQEADVTEPTYFLLLGKVGGPGYGGVDVFQGLFLQLNVGELVDGQEVFRRVGMGTMKEDRSGHENSHILSDEQWGVVVGLSTSQTTQASLRDIIII